MKFSHVRRFQKNSRISTELIHGQNKLAMPLYRPRFRAWEPTSAQESPMKSIGLRHMKTVQVISIALGYVLLLTVASQAQCSNRTLSGNYSFTVEGQILGVGPVNGVAETHFDGAGNLTQVDFVVHAG